MIQEWSICNLIAANVFTFTTIRVGSIILLFNFLHAPLASLIIWIWLNYSLPINSVINGMIITLLLKLRSKSDICSKHILDLGVDVNLQLISLTVFLTRVENQPLLPPPPPPTFLLGPRSFLVEHFNLNSFIIINKSRFRFPLGNCFVFWAGTWQKPNYFRVDTR